MAEVKSLKHKLFSRLEQYEWFFKFKYSTVVYSLLRKKNPKLQRTLDAEFRLYSSALDKMPSEALIFDIGANLGYTLEIFEKIGGSVVAVEPDLINLNCLRARYGKKSQVIIVPMAVSDAVGEEIIYLQDNGGALHTLSDKWKTFLEDPNNDRRRNLLNFSKKRAIKTTSIEALIEAYGVPYFIKIDVEGYEEKVISGLKTQIPMISFEANLPQFLKETIRCIEHLDGQGATVTFNYASYDKLLLPQFVSRSEIVDIISSTDLRCIDIFCKT